MNTFLEVFMQRREELVQLLLEHIQMTSAAVLISICIGIPLGIFVTKNKKASSIVIGIANIMQSIPSIGLLAFLVPVVGNRTEAGHYHGYHLCPASDHKKYIYRHHRYPAVGH